MESTTASALRSFHHGNLRTALLDEALALIVQVGTESFSLREAARRVGVSPNAAYRHFTDKGALLAALAQSGFTALAGAMEEELERAGADPIKRLKATGLAYLSFAAAEPYLFNLMFGPYGAGSGRDVTGHGPHSGKTSSQLFSDAIDAMVDAGLISPDRKEGARTLLWSSVHGLAVLSQASILSEPIEPAFDRIFALQFQGLLDRKTKTT